MRVLKTSLGLGLLTSVSVLAACRGGTSQNAREQAAADGPTPQYTTTATVRDLMLGIVDPSADVVWNSVNTVITENAVVETMPKTDDEWAQVRYGAIRLAEASNLLLVPGRAVMAPHEKSVAPGVELEGPEMEVLINKDRAAWNKRVQALHEAAVKALNAIEAKDAPRLFEIGEQIEHACEGCHSQYWYPNQQLPPGYGQ